MQYALITGRLGPVLGTWRFFGFFTILTNLAVALVATQTWRRPGTALARPVPRFAVLCSILLVGLTYSIALRSTWSPTGWQKLADMALHDAAPLVYLLAWVAAPHGQIAWRQIGWALLLPAGYLAYAMLRGAGDGWYAYWFLDPRALSAAHMALSIALLLGAVLTIAVILFGIDRLLAHFAEAKTGLSG